MLSNLKKKHVSLKVLKVRSICQHEWMLIYLGIKFNYNWYFWVTRWWQPSSQAFRRGIMPSCLYRATRSKIIGFFLVWHSRVRLKKLLFNSCLTKNECLILKQNAYILNQFHKEICKDCYTPLQGAAKGFSPKIFFLND